MPSNYYLSIEEYEKIFDLRRINCLATSLIRTYNLEHELEIRLSSCKMDTRLEIGEAYLTKVDDLQEFLGYDRSNLKRITFESINQSPANEFRLIYGFQKTIVPVKLGDVEFDREDYDFHVIIGVRDNSGKVRWYHKFGVSMEIPREVTLSDWEEIRTKYTDCPTPVLFEFEEPQR